MALSFKYKMTDFPTLSNVSTSEIPFIYLKPDRVPLSGKASPYRPFIRIPPPERTIFFTPTVTVKYHDLDLTKPSYREQILTVPWPSQVILGIHCFKWATCLFVCSSLRYFVLTFVELKYIQSGNLLTKRTFLKNRNTKKN